jgi:hypothetical protein
VQSRWFLGDLDHLMARLLKSEKALDLPKGARSRVGTLVDFFKLKRPGMYYEVERWDDLRPFWLELRLWLLAFFRRRDA